MSINVVVMVKVHRTLLDGDLFEVSTSNIGTKVVQEGVNSNHSRWVNEDYFEIKDCIAEIHTSNTPIVLTEGFFFVPYRDVTLVLLNGNDITQRWRNLYRIILKKE